MANSWLIAFTWRQYNWDTQRHTLGYNTNSPSMYCPSQNIRTSMRYTQVDCCIIYLMLVLIIP